MTETGTDTVSKPKVRLADIPRGVWALGFVSMFMDISSEMIHALLPVFLVTGLGASMVAVGFIEGIAEATASITKVFSGVLSDWLGKRKWLAAIGYGMAAFTKPVFPLASTLSWLIAARFIDRVGKGIRGAPRDALVADLTPKHLRGAAYGLRQSLDTLGAVIGPLLAIVLMLWLHNDFRAVFWFAVIPAFIAFFLIVVAVREPERPVDAAARQPLRFSDVRLLGGAFVVVTAIGSALTLARFSEAFLVLKAQSDGLAIAFVPIVLVVMNLVYSLASTPAGFVADRFGRKGLMSSGIVVLILADLVLAWSTSISSTFLGVMLWGLHMGLTQGLLSTLVADAAPAHLRGTAFGVFNLCLGLAMLAASVAAGSLWSWLGPAGTFLAGAAFSLLALVGLGLYTMWTKSGPATGAV